ncbi:MAG: hypothetical protein PHD37_10775 [Gallionellaceae bacterium]|nr:hypothetical protein [Gallionellaceae bacterium]
MKKEKSVYSKEYFDLFNSSIVKTDNEKIKEKLQEIKPTILHFKNNHNFSLNKICEVMKSKVIEDCNIKVDVKKATFYKILVDVLGDNVKQNKVVVVPAVSNNAIENTKEDAKEDKEKLTLDKLYSIDVDFKGVYYSFSNAKTLNNVLVQMFKMKLNKLNINEEELNNIEEIKIQLERIKAFQNQVS